MRETLKARQVCLVTLAVGVLSAVGCGPSAPAPGDGPPAAAPPAEVGVVHPERKSLRRVVEQPGTVQAYEETQLFARVPGYVRRLRPEIDIGYKARGPKYDASGREVEPGEVLAELAVPELEEEVRQKRAMVRQAEAEVDQADRAVAAATATIAVAQAAVTETQSNYERWESQANRMAGLAKERVVATQSSEETLNQFRAAGGRLASAKAAVQKAQADRDRAEADVRAAKSRVEVAAAAAAHAEVMLSYATIRAPYDAVVTRRKVSTGDFVQPAGGQGDWLFRVARLDPVRVVIAVPEADADLVTDRAEVKLTITALANPNLTGAVTRTSWVLEPGARTLRAEIELPNKEGRLRPGTYVSAQVVAPLPENWVLPAAALVKQGDVTVCFLVEDGKAVRTPVQVGRGDGQLTQVLERQKPNAPSAWEDFTGDERVAALAAGLTDGQPVEGAK